MWNTKNDQLSREFKCKNFREAMVFIQLIAFEAEKMDHHPDIHNIYNLVEIKLYTHTAGDKATEKDKKMALKIDKIWDDYFA